MTPNPVAFTQWGAYRVAVEDGRIASVSPFENDPEPSAIGRSLVDADRARVLRPAVRRSWLNGGPGTATELRGREPFVEVDWDTALDLVAGELDRVRSHFGNEAIYGGSYGWSSTGRFHHAQSQIHRFLACIGGYVRSVNTYSHAAGEVIVPHVLGMSFGDLQTSHTSLEVVAKHTDTFVAFGGIASKNSQVQSGGHGRHVTAQWLRRAAERGTNFVSISPIADDLADDLAGEWIPIRPNTDTALVLALLRELDATGTADHDFLDRYCVGWDRLSAYLAGRADGKVRDARWAESITGVAAGRTSRLAEEMATGRTMVNASWSVQRTHHGEMAFWSVIALAAALGQIGLAGGGFGLGYGAVGSVGNGAVRRPVPGIGRGPNPVTQFIPVARVADMLLDPRGSFTYDGGTYEYPDIRLVYWSGGNPFHHHQDLNRLVEAWQRPDTVIVHDPYWTATARHADVVFPMTTAMERVDVGGSSADDYVFFMERLVDPPGEARDDHWAFSELAGRLGVGAQFTEGRDPDEWLRFLWKGHVATYPDAPTFEELRELGHHRNAPSADDDGLQVLLEDFRADPYLAALGTPSGRIELWSDEIASFDLADCPPHPAWMEPYEWLGSASPGQLHLISHQPATRLHSQLDFGVVSKEAKVAGREAARLSPNDAEQRGISEGDVVRLFNSRGSCLAGAVVDQNVMDGVVVLPTGAWFDPDEDGMCRHGNPNVLTADRPSSSLAQAPSAHTCLVEVEHVDNPPDPPTPHDRPAFVTG